jgi:hypothetical protein
MLETKWQIDEEEGKGWSYEKSGNLFSSMKTNLLKQRLIELLKNKEKVFNGDVYEFTLRLGYLPKHVVDLFSGFQDQGKLTIISENSDKIRKGAFYIGYDNYKANYKKVYFKLT